MHISFMSKTSAAFVYSVHQGLGQGGEGSLTRSLKGWSVDSALRRNGIGEAGDYRLLTFCDFVTQAIDESSRKWLRAKFLCGCLV